MSNEMMSVNIWLAGRSYRIRIKAEDESVVRRAAKLADEKVTEVKDSYAGKDEQDFLAMSLLMYATESALSANNDPLMNDELKKMSSKIDKVIG